MICFRFVLKRMDVCFQIKQDDSRTLNQSSLDPDMRGVHYYLLAKAWQVDKPKGTDTELDISTSKKISTPLLPTKMQQVKYDVEKEKWCISKNEKMPLTQVLPRLTTSDFNLLLGLELCIYKIYIYMYIFNT